MVAKNTFNNEKLKYSPGIPFTMTYKTRKQMLQDGWDKIFIRRTYDLLGEDKYPTSWNQSFAKSQIVPVMKLINGKDIRTVVAQDLASSFLDHVITFERLKRQTMFETGCGTGLVLNQNMVKLYEALDEKRQLGWKLGEGNGKAYDSKLEKYAAEAMTAL
ncbi:10144_t:CDS:1, partial [Racocetra fulgida]